MNYVVSSTVFSELFDPLLGALKISLSEDVAIGIEVVNRK